MHQEQWPEDVPDELDLLTALLVYYRRTTQSVTDEDEVRVLVPSATLSALRHVSSPHQHSYRERQIVRKSACKMRSHGHVRRWAIQAFITYRIFGCRSTHFLQFLHRTRCASRTSQNSSSWNHVIRSASLLRLRVALAEPATDPATETPSSERSSLRSL